MSNKNQVFEYLIDQLRQQVGNNPYKQQCEDLAHEVRSLKNQLRDASAQLKELHLALVRATGDSEAYKLMRKGAYGSEQSGCRKDDTQECEHEWLHSKHKTGFVCFNCGARKECEHAWVMTDADDFQTCSKCGELA